MKETVMQLQPGVDTLFSELRHPGDARDADDDGLVIKDLGGWDDTERYMVTRNWTFGLGSGMSNRPLGVVVELLNYAEHGMDEPVEDCYNSHPWALHLGLMAVKPAKVTADYDCSALSDDDVLLHVWEHHGGVPITHIAVEEIRSAGTGNGTEEFRQVLQEMKIDTVTHAIPLSFGAAYAQGHQYEQLVMFQTSEDAYKAAMWLVKQRCPAICGMVGFFLDRPINMVGDTGWSVLERQCRPLRKKEKK